MTASRRRRFGAEEARWFYDRLGSAQDSQAIYEKVAVDGLLAAGAFAEALKVFELGCGTGRLAERLMRDLLPPTANYLGVDVSTTMVGLAQARLSEWPGRASVIQVPGGQEALPTPDGSMDRVLTTYVLDLLDAEDRAWTLQECHRVLGGGGLLCHAGIAPGKGVVTSAVSGLWKGLHRISPWLVGGCRPFLLEEHLPGEQWRVRHHERVARFGITSEVLVAEAI